MKHFYSKFNIKIIADLTTRWHKEGSVFILLHEISNWLNNIQYVPGNIADNLYWSYEFYGI